MHKSSRRFIAIRPTSPETLDAHNHAARQMMFDGWLAACKDIHDNG